jgi:cytochrome c-type biogenesis protein CcmH
MSRKTGRNCSDSRRPKATRCSVTIAVLALVLTGVMGACTASAAEQAVDVNGQLEDPGLQTRFERIVKDLRCLVCQNESIADSNADLAVDLRQQVREMLVAGKSDDAIFDFMTNRYGEFVRFNPPVEAKTVLIWGAPFFMLLLGGVIIFRIVRHRSRLPLDDESAARP